MRNRPKRALIYNRVSSSQQAIKGTGLAIQSRANREYAKAQCYQVIAEFNEVCTGTIFARPEMSKVLELIKQGGIDVLIVWASDRLARNTQVGEQYDNIFRYYDVGVEYGNIDYRDCQTEVKKLIQVYLDKVRV